MKKASLIICALILAFFFFNGNSFAMALGAYIDFGGGTGEAEYDYEGAEEFDYDTGFFGVGFQFETSPLIPNKLYSYRFQAGFEGRDIEDEGDMTLELGGLVINNTFAFGGMVSQRVRLWGGPQVAVGFYSGETDKEYLGDKYSFSGAAIGLGAAGGANIGLGGGKAILTTTIGVRAFRFAGNAEWRNQDEDLSGSNSEIYLSVGILFGL